MKKFALVCVVVLILVSSSSCFALRDSSDPSPAPSDLTGTTHISSAPVAGGYIRSLMTPCVPDVGTKVAPKLPKPADPYAGVSVSLLAVGDNLIHENITSDARSRGTEDKRYNFLPIYTDVASEIYSADIAFINQETVMAGEKYGYTSYPTFNAPQDLGDDLVTLGFDVINIANNHMLDKGTQGLLDTIEFWHSQPVTLIGGYTSADDCADIRITEADDIRIAWLSYTYGTNGIVKESWSEAVVPYIDDDTIISDIAAAEEIADFVIVSIHWGDENTQTPNAEQRRLSQLIADSGADLILGHHSHTVQPIEWIKTDRGDVLCAYSLGNFISGMIRPVNEVGGMLTLDITSDGRGGLTVTNVLFTPTVFWFDFNWQGTRLYLMEDLTPELAASHRTVYEGYTFTVESARELITNTIDAEFLPDYLK